jgi:hypothetical protein
LRFRSFFAVLEGRSSVLRLAARLFLSLREAYFFGFGKDDSNSEARKGEADLFLSLALFFLAEEGGALPELGGLMLRPEVYSQALMYVSHSFKVLFARFCL